MIFDVQIYLFKVITIFYQQKRFFLASVTNNHGEFDVNSWISLSLSRVYADINFFYPLFFIIFFYYQIFVSINFFVIYQLVMYQSHGANSASTCRSLSRPKTRERDVRRRNGYKGNFIFMFCCSFSFFLGVYTCVKILERDHVPSSTEK